MIDIVKTKTEALLKLRPNSSFAVFEDRVEWYDTDIAIPTDSEIADAEELFLEEEAAKEYSRKRETEYPLIEEQLDMQYWDSVNGTTTWKDAIQAVKDAHPKPE